MKIKKLLGLLVGTACCLSFLSGCIIDKFEEEINVTFANEGVVIGTGTVTQFKNIQSPKLSDAYVPDGYKFLGWTCLSQQELDLTNATNFKIQYVGGGRMVHYMEVKPFAVDHAVTMEALVLPKDEIPKDYHYAVVAWYDKVATSGLNQDKMDGFESMLKTYLASEGVSQDDINSVVLRGYTGNVGPSTGQILYDDDVDIMFGWSTNISSTGSIPAESVKQEADYTVGTLTRKVHRLTDSEGCLKVMEYLLSDAVRAYFAGQEEKI